MRISLQPITRKHCNKNPALKLPRLNLLSMLALVVLNPAAEKKSASI
jgi:hypothetical protein